MKEYKILKNNQEQIATITNYDAAKAYVNNLLANTANTWSYQEHLDFYRTVGYTKRGYYYAGLETRDKSKAICYVIA